MTTRMQRFKERLTGKPSDIVIQVARPAKLRILRSITNSSQGSQIRPPTGQGR